MTDFPLPEKRNGRWRIWVERSDYTRTTEVHILNEMSDGSVDVITNITFERVGPENRARGVSMPIADGEEFLRAALNAAWEYGLRPDGFMDTREAMVATKAHLADMRTLALEGIRGLARDHSEILRQMQEAGKARP